MEAPETSSRTRTRRTKASALTLGRRSPRRYRGRCRQDRRVRGHVMSSMIKQPEEALQIGGRRRSMLHRRLRCHQSGLLRGILISEYGHLIRSLARQCPTVRDAITGPGLFDRSKGGAASEVTRHRGRNITVAGPLSRQRAGMASMITVVGRSRCLLSECAYIVRLRWHRRYSSRCHRTLSSH